MPVGFRNLPGDEPEPDVEDLTVIILDGIYGDDRQTSREIGIAHDAVSKLIKKVTQAERERCLDIVQECRAEGETDLRSIIYRISNDEPES